MITFNAKRTLDDDSVGSPEFNAVYRFTVVDLGDDVEGWITDMRADGHPWAFAPDVTHSEANDVDLEEGWQALTGHTGQHGYRGAVMHPSEQWSQCHVDDLITLADNPDGGLFFAIVEVRDEDGNFPDGDPIGWAVVYKLGII